MEVAILANSSAGDLYEDKHSLVPNDWSSLCWHNLRIAHPAQFDSSCVACVDWSTECTVSMSLFKVSSSWLLPLTWTKPYCRLVFSKTVFYSWPSNTSRRYCVVTASRNDLIKGNMDCNFWYLISFRGWKCGQYSQSNFTMLSLQQTKKLWRR